MILRVLDTLGVELFARSGAGSTSAAPHPGVDLDSLLASMTGPDVYLSAGGLTSVGDRGR